MRFYRTLSKATHTTSEDVNPDGQSTIERIETEEVGWALRSGYVPSVTTILGIIRYPYIEEWLIARCLESYEESGRFKEALAYRDTTAAEFGSTCHALLESHLQGQPCAVPHDHRHEQACEPLWEWIETNVEMVLFSECGFANGELGYGGTADMLVLLKEGRQMLLDLKTKKNHLNYPMGPDMTCRYQLSAYRRHFEQQYGPMSIGNLFLASPFGSRPQPKLVFVDYGEGDWFEGFEAARRLWLEQNDIGHETLSSVGNRKPLSAQGDLNKAECADRTHMRIVGHRISHKETSE